VSINGATGLLSGTPAKAGTFSVRVTATDTTGASGSAAFSVTVLSPIGFTGVGPQAGYLGQPALVDISATDAVPGRTIGYSADGLPAGLSIDSSTGLISGLPGSAGYHRVTVTAHDDAGASRSVSFIWYLAPAQASGRTGSIRLGDGRTCLADKGGKVRLWECDNGQDQAWAVQPGGSVRAMGECLDVAGTADGTPVGISACDGSGGQQWRIASFGQLVNPPSGKCLDDPASRAANGTPLDIRSCTGGAGERWTVPAGPFVSAVTGLCADASDQVRAWYCGAVNTQAWTVEPDGSVQIAGRCLDVHGGATVDAARCDRTGAQQWRVRPDGTLVNPATGKCLADTEDSPVVGTRLVIDSCEVRAGEVWHVE
jgi:hypothetical protein